MTRVPDRCHHKPRLSAHRIRIRICLHLFDIQNQFTRARKMFLSLIEDINFFLFIGTTKEWGSAQVKAVSRETLDFILAELVAIEIIYVI
jgi:hypothetical protein